MEWHDAVAYYEDLAARGSATQPMIELLKHLALVLAREGFRPFSVAHCVTFTRAQSFQEARMRPSISVRYLRESGFEVSFVDAETDGFGVTSYVCPVKQVEDLVNAMILRLDLVERYGQ